MGNLNVSSVVGQQINVVVVTGPVGPQGPAGLDGTGAGGAAGVSSLNTLTGALTLNARNGGISPSGSTLFISGFAPTSTQINGYALTGNITLRSADIPVNFLPGATYSNLQQFINTMNSPGLIQGALITDGGGGIANISVGTGMLRVADDNVSSLSFVNIPATGLAVPADVVQYYVGFIYNSGSPRFELRAANSWDNDTEIALGTVVNYFGQLVITNNPFLVGDPITNIIQRFDAMAPVTRDATIGGLTLGEVGTRNITLSAGRLWTRLNDYDIIARSTLASDTMYGASFNGVYWDYQTPLTQWPNTQYNDIAAGLVTMDDTYYANLWFYCGVENGALGFIYGQAQWGTYTEAAAEQAPSLLPANFLTTNVLVARLTFQKGALSAALISSAFTTIFTTAPVSIHNTLGGLQGGTTNEYYHLTAQNWSNLTGLSDRLTVPTYLTLSSTASGASLDIGAGGVLGTTAFTGVSRMNSLTGGVYIEGTRGLSVSNSGQTIFVSGQDWVTSGALAQTGVQLQALIAITGQQAWGAADANGINLSGALTQTGTQLVARDIIVSGALDAKVGATGNQLFTTLMGMSGQANVNYATVSTVSLISGNLIQSGVQLIGRDNAISGGLEVRITASGNSAVNHATSIGSIISGNLTQTGIQIGLVSGAMATNLTASGAVLAARDLAISGALEGRITSSGNAAVAQANSIGQTLSGNLTITGTLLSSIKVTGSSTINTVNLIGLGAVSVISSGSSVFVSGSAGGGGEINTASNLGLGSGIFSQKSTFDLQFNSIQATGNVALTYANNTYYLSGIVSAGGAVTQGQLDSLSGYSNTLFATTGSVALVSGNLIQTGIQLGALINGISGGLEVRLVATGNSSVSHANGIGTNLSGSLTLTGQTLQGRIDLVSGLVLSASGGLETRIIASGNSAVNHANSIGSIISGNLTQTGLQVGLVSGAIATNLTNTGVSLINRDNSISGGLETRIIASGQSVLIHANSIGTTISGNLTATGLQIGLVSGGLEVRILATGNSVVAHANSIGVAISGNLTQTGVSLIARDVATSGALDTRLTSTGLQIQSLLASTGSLLYGMVTGSSGISNSITTTLSSNLTQTGVQIGIISGALDTRLAATGSALFARDLAISGALQALIAGGGSVVKISGGAPLATADFVGIGSTIVFSSGGQVFVSGAAAVAGGGVPSVNGITSAVAIAGTGNFTTVTVGSTIYVSGSVLTQNKQILFDNNNITTGDDSLTWDNVNEILTVGTAPNSMSITPYFISGGSGQFSFSGIANNPIAAMFTSGYGNTAYGPALYDRRTKCIVPNITTSQTLYGGDTAANVGTLSTVVTETLGEYTLYTPAAGLSAGTSFTTATAFRGTGPGVGNGFFFVSTFLLNSNWASGLNVGTYGAPSGCRIFVGLTDQAVATQTQLNDPVGNYIGLRYLWASGGAVGTGQYMQNWSIGSRDNTQAATGDIGMTFQTGLYRFSMFCPKFPNNNIIYYQMDDVLRGSGVKGQVTQRLPVGSTALRPMAALGFVSGIKAIATKTLYIETQGGAL